MIVIFVFGVLIFLGFDSYFRVKFISVINVNYLWNIDVVVIYYRWLVLIKNSDMLIFMFFEFEGSSEIKNFCVDNENFFVFCDRVFRSYGVLWYEWSWR